MKVILSIKPEFANKIFDGTKKYEFRRTIFNRNDITSVVVYASAPISKVIGEFEIEQVLHKELKPLWKDTSDYSGISQEYYWGYFKGKDSGYAIKVKSYKKYRTPYNIEDRYGLKAPQSFAYIK